MLHNVHELFTNLFVYFLLRSLRQNLYSVTFTVAKLHECSSFALLYFNPVKAIGVRLAIALTELLQSSFPLNFFSRSSAP